MIMKHDLQYYKEYRTICILIILHVYAFSGCKYPNFSYYVWTNYMNKNIVDIYFQ